MKCPTCHGFGGILVEVDPDAGRIYDVCPTCEEERAERASAAYAAAQRATQRAAVERGAA